MAIKILEVTKQQMLVEYYNEFNSSIRGKYRLVLSSKKLEIFEDSSSTTLFANDLIEEILINLIDLDSWKESWHMSVRGYKYDKAILDSLKDILNKKIQSREREIESLKYGLKILRKRNSIEGLINKTK